MLCPVYSNSLCHLSKLCGLPPIQAAKNPLCGFSIPYISAQTAHFFFKRALINKALINKSSFSFHTSQTLLQRWFPSPVLSPWHTLSAHGEFPSPSKPSNHQHLLTPSHIIPLGCWASSLRPAWPAVPLPSPVCHFTSIFGFSPKFSLCSRADLWKELSGTSPPS